MLKRLTVLAAVAVLALPAAAISSTPAGAASASCKAQLKAMGSTNFYNTSTSVGYKTFGACVSKAQHLTPTQFVGAGLVVAAIVTMQLRARPRWRTA